MTALGLRAGDVVRAAFAASVERLRAHERAAIDATDPEGVHQARVATRRLRSDLRTFSPLLEWAWVKALRSELRWLGDALGRTRDVDVLAARVRARVEALPGPTRAAARPILESLAQETAAAHAELLSVLSSDRYVMLRERLAEAAEDPALTAGAAAPASTLLPSLVRGPWHALVEEVRRAGYEPTDSELHAIRIRAKRARYAAEAVALAVGKPAERFAKAAAALQGLLGEHQDAVVAQDWLGRWAEGAATDGAAVAQVLVESERRAALDVRGRWRAAWEKLAGPELTAWL